jgi:DNA invertase Pin-like site-specific DNA recombinase
VSTARQGRSGLGIEAQRAAVANYRNGGDWRIIAEFTEVESGKRSDRRELDKALAAARVHRVPVVVAKVDRLTRSVAFLSRLLEAGVDVRFADLPAIEGPTGRFILQQMAAVAELEAGMISKRTRDALAAAKRRGKKLGGDRGARLRQRRERRAARPCLSTLRRGLAIWRRRLPRYGRAVQRRCAGSRMRSMLGTSRPWRPLVGGASEPGLGACVRGCETVHEQAV